MAEQNPSFEHTCQAQHEAAIRGASSSARQNTVYQIPVVFHVVHNTPEQNLSDEIILDQLEILNQDYRRTNPNASETREVFLPVAADVEIEFVLASEDPDGNPTDGIIHKETEATHFEFSLFSQDITLDAVKFESSGGSDAWDTNHYLNIWVCNIQTDFGGQLFGFAYPPENAENWEGLFPTVDDAVDGVVVHYTVVGSNNPAGEDDGFTGNEGGRTLTHEVGHYLGLRHIWGDAFFDGCSTDDGISDTPDMSTSNNFFCDFNADTCLGDDFPDMSENYMDYNQDDCLNMFTEEQKAVMRWNLENIRTELIEEQIVSVEEREMVALDIYPNPANESVNINLNSKGSLYIFDAQGREVRKELVNPGLQSIDIRNFAPGMYIVQFSGSSIASGRLMVRD